MSLIAVAQIANGEKPIDGQRSEAPLFTACPINLEDFRYFVPMGMGWGAMLLRLIMPISIQGTGATVRKSTFMRQVTA